MFARNRLLEARRNWLLEARRMVVRRSRWWHRAVAFMPDTASPPWIGLPVLMMTGQLGLRIQYTTCRAAQRQATVTPWGIDPILADIFAAHANTESQHHTPRRQARRPVHYVDHDRGMKRLNRAGHVVRHDVDVAEVVVDGVISEPTATDRASRGVWSTSND